MANKVASAAKVVRTIPDSSSIALGRFAIACNPIAVVHELIRQQKQVVRAFDEAEARGDGSIALGGQLIDLPIVERARRTLELAKALGV
jgi:citrate lyase beta subunit